MPMVMVPLSEVRVMALVIVAVSALTSLEELSQSMLANRIYDPADMLCNVAGTWCFGVGSLLLPMRRSMSKNDTDRS